MKERFNQELLAGKEQSARAKAEKEEKKTMTDKKKELQLQIKTLESELVALGMKKSEIKRVRENAKEGILK